MDNVLTHIYPLLLQEHRYERLIRYTALVLLVVFALGYVYLVSASVLHVVARREANTAQVKTQSAIANLESRYFDLTKGITIDSAHEFNLTPVASKSFVTRTSSHAYVSGAEGGI